MEFIWLVAATAVFVATIVQTVTGAGLGIMAGPILLLAMGATEAIPVAVVLNLTLSLILLPGELRELPVKALGTLCLGAVVGLPVGLWALSLASLPTLKLLAALTVTAGGVQMCLAARSVRPTRPSSTLPLFGAVSGAMTSALAIPGPVALWGLSKTQLTVTEVRATLRAYFVLAYACTLSAYALSDFDWPSVLRGSLWMTGPLIAGALVGMYVKQKHSGQWLRTAFVALVLLTGVTMLVESAWSYLS